MNTVPLLEVAPVVSSREVMPGVIQLWLETPAVARTALPGQYVMLKCGADTFLRRPFSIHRVTPDRSQVAFLFAVVGKGTVWLAGRKPGERIDLLGPLGNGFHIAPQPSGAVMIAGGLGIAPLAFLGDELHARGIKIELLYGAANSGLLCPDALLPPSSSCLLATEDGSRGEEGFITSYLARRLSPDAQIFACGPAPMYRTLERMEECRERSVQVSLEVRMACGLGVCYGCTIYTRRGLRQVCKHGPVFELSDVLWDKMVDI